MVNRNKPSLADDGSTRFRTDLETHCHPPYTTHFAPTVTLPCEPLMRWGTGFVLRAVQKLYVLSVFSGAVFCWSREEMMMLRGDIAFVRVCPGLPLYVMERGDNDLTREQWVNTIASNKKLARLLSARNWLHTARVKWFHHKNNPRLICETKNFFSTTFYLYILTMDSDSVPETLSVQINV